MIYKILVLLIIIQQSVYAQDPEQLLIEANEKMAKADLAIADSLLKESLKVDPSFAPAHIGFSELWLRRGDLNKANTSATKAVQMDEEFRSWWNGLNDIRNKIQNGKRNVQQGQFDAAITDYESILEKHPYFPEAHFYMGLTKFRQKDIEGAAYYFSEALKLYPDHMKARKGLNNVTKQLLNNGNKAYKRGDLDKATDFYIKATKYDETFHLAFYQLGVLEKKIGNSENAISYFKKVISIKPDFHKAWFTLGAAYEADNNLDSALVKYNKAIELKPEYTKVYGSLGNIYTKMGDYQSAQDVLQIAVQIDPTYADAYLRLGVVFIEQAEKLEEDSKQTNIIENNQADLLLRSQEFYKKASVNFKKATENDNKNYDSWYRYASSLNATKQYNDASLAAQKCIDLKTKFGGGWYEKGVAEWKNGRGNKQRSLKYFEEQINLEIFAQPLKIKLIE